MSKQWGHHRPHQRCANCTTVLSAVEKSCRGAALATKHDLTPMRAFVLGLSVVWLIPTGRIKPWTFDHEGDAEVFLPTS